MRRREHPITAAARYRTMLEQAIDIGEKQKVELQELKKSKTELSKEVNELGEKLMTATENQLRGVGKRGCVFMTNCDDEDISSDTAECFKCKICLTRVARFSCIPCGHTFCKTCLQKVYEMDKKCSICRTPFCKIFVCRFP